MTRCRVANLYDIKPGELKRVEVDGTPICLARLENGELFALSDICSHEDVELSDGDLQGMEVECPAHGSRFHVQTGDVRGLPAESPVPTYRLTIEDDDVYVDV
jgi:3-phenylpropionate/trans-cinnamate dioxygenase ferredoxin component